MATEFQSLRLVSWQNLPENKQAETLFYAQTSNGQDAFETSGQIKIKASSRYAWFSVGELQGSPKSDNVYATDFDIPFQR